MQGMSEVRSHKVALCTLMANNIRQYQEIMAKAGSCALEQISLEATAFQLDTTFYALEDFGKELARTIKLAEELGLDVADPELYSRLKEDIF